jgi:hypothetical protein
VYERQFQQAVTEANRRLQQAIDAGEPAQLIASEADLQEARVVVAPVGRRSEGSLNRWVNDLFTYFRDPNPETRTERATVDVLDVEKNAHIRLVSNRADQFTRLQARTIDAAQTELNEHYRVGAHQGDRSSAYLVIREHILGGRGGKPQAVVEGTLHYDKCQRAVDLLQRLEPGLPETQREIVVREREKMQSALQWADAYGKAEGPEPTLPGWAQALAEELLKPPE